MFNKKGAITLEASIVTPMVILIFCLLIMLLIYMFQYNLQVFRVHEEVLTLNKSSNKSLDFELLGKSYPLTYAYEQSGIHMKTLQRWLHFIIDYIDKYTGVFK